MNCIP